jgi:hypothetical protein
VPWWSEHLLAVEKKVSGSSRSENDRPDTDAMRASVSPPASTLKAALARSLLTHAAMRTTLGVVFLIAGCAARVESTTASGSVGGVSFRNPTAISHESTGLLDPSVVLITDQPSPCATVVVAGIGVPDGVNTDAGVRAASLMVRSFGDAFLDVGGSATRLRTDAGVLDITEKDKDGTLRGHFSATFGTETLQGDFVAPACSRLSGCSASGAAALPLLALLALLAGRARRG